MLTTFLTVILLWAVHTFADFVMQSDEQAKQKSSSMRWLVSHTATYSIIWVFAGCFLFDNAQAAVTFGAITFLAHTATDYVTSRWVKKYFSKNDIHNGFVVIGFDQLLHLVQILLTYYFIVKP